VGMATATRKRLAPNSGPELDADAVRDGGTDDDAHGDADGDADCDAHRASLSRADHDADGDADRDAGERTFCVAAWQAWSWSKRRLLH